MTSNTSSDRHPEPRADTLLRSATALLITFAAALVLLHAQIYAGAVPHPTTALWSTAANTADPR